MEFYELHLAINAVQDLAEGRVDEIELFLIQAKGDGKRDRFAGLAADERFVHAFVVGEIGPVAVDRLLEVAHHAETPGTRTIELRLKPTPGRVGRACHFEQD